MLVFLGSVLAVFGVIFAVGWLREYTGQDTVVAAGESKISAANNGGAAAVRGAAAGLGLVVDVLYWMLERIRGVMLVLVAMLGLMLASDGGVDGKLILTSLLLLGLGIYKLVD